jgi:HK97 family phage portal protein
MGRIKKAFNALLGKSGPYTYEELVLAMGWGGGAVEESYFPFALTTQYAFERNVVGYKCVMEVSKAVGGLSWYLMDTAKNVEITSHPLLNLLATPNPTQAKSSLLQHLQAFKMLDGNAFLELNGPGGNSPPTELWAKRPDWVQILPGATQLPSQYVYTPGGAGTAGPARSYPVNQINGKCDLLHVKSFAPLFEEQQLRGLSPVRSAIQQTLTHNEAVVWNKRLIKNGLAPAGVFSTDQGLSEEQVKALKTQISESYSGSRNAGKTMVLEGGLKFNQTSMNPKDADFMSMKDSVARDIAMALGVPPILLHIPGDSTYNNVKDARMALYEETILPEARVWRDDFNRWLVPRFGKNLRLEIDEDDISALFPRRQIKWQMVTNSNFLTTNERRREFGYPPIPGPAGDEVFVPSNQVPINVALDPTLGSEPPPIDSGEGDGEE